MDKPLAFIYNENDLLLQKSPDSDFYSPTNKPNVMFTIKGALKCKYRPIYEQSELDDAMHQLKDINIANTNKTNLIKAYGLLLKDVSEKYTTQHIGLELINHTGFIGTLITKKIEWLNNVYLLNHFIKYYIAEVEKIPIVKKEGSLLTRDEEFKKSIFDMIHSNISVDDNFFLDMGIDNIVLGRKILSEVGKMIVKQTFDFYDGLIKTNAAVAYLFNEDGDIITISRINDYNDVGLIGGMVDVNENPEDGIRREIYEEIGVKVEDIRFVGRQNKQTYHIDVFTSNQTDWSRVRLGDSGEGKVAIYPLEQLFKPSSYREFNCDYLVELIANWKKIFNGEHKLDFYFVEDITPDGKTLVIYMTCFREPKLGEYVLTEDSKGVSINLATTQEPQRCIIKTSNFSERSELPHSDFLMYYRDDILNKLQYFSISKLVKNE